MTIYWLLLAFPALMALTYPVHTPRFGYGPAQALAMLTFLLLYALLGALRFETGGDWLTYDEMFEDMRTESLIYALTETDPLYGFLNWFSAQLGTGIYLVNFVCCWVLGYGTVRVAMRFREPWLAITIAVPYLLIVVGLGYVRQGAAIGCVLIAIASLDQSRPLRTLVYLALAVGFHSTAVMTLPMFGYALTRRYQVFAVLFGVLGALAYVFVLAPRLALFEVGYLDAEYDSQGALVRVLMSLVPSLFLLLRWRSFQASKRVRSTWFLIALANVVALVALALSPSSTAVDRIALFFSIIQLVAFGEVRDLTRMPERGVMLLRLVMIAVAIAVQTVWLVYGAHAQFWVPYKSVLQTL